MKLDAIGALLRKHDLDIQTKLDQIAVAKRVLKQTKLQGLIEDMISRKMRPADIVKELVRQGACSRATAYRYLARIPVKVAISKKETEPRWLSFH